MASCSAYPWCSTRVVAASFGSPETPLSASAAAARRGRAARAAAFETPPRANPKYKIYHCFLRDPDGYQIEIQRFDNDAWPAPG
jgi:hypothetical protein